MSAVAELLAELVASDSTNPTLEPGGAGEAATAELLADRMRRAGLEVDVWDAAPGRPNVVGRLTGSGGGRSLMFCGHTDVVGGDRSQFQPRVARGRMYGRGTNDMKGGIAAALVAVERLAAGPRPAGDVLLAFVIDEEWASLGAEALVERHRADAAVLPEQTDLDVVFAHGGFAWYDVRSIGREAAGGDPLNGVDGIALSAPILDGVLRLDADLETRTTPEWGRPNVHVSTIRGGQNYPSYPAECVIGIERCLMPGESLADSMAEMEALLDLARSSDGRFQGGFQTVIGREPVLLDRDEPVVAGCIEAARAVLGHDPVVRSDYGWMDSGVLVESGVPCVIFGPTGEGLHTAEEWVDLASLQQCVDVFERLARDFCGAAT
ncbi:MAG: succinyl-diaminopimelate desuccinylase [Gaiellales bacterium]|jgi:acetylornithine deacetylase|nr:succinyl-diaminopimelate desuccinylase [Gaiellales bacterium]